VARLKSCRSSASVMRRVLQDEETCSPICSAKALQWRLAPFRMFGPVPSAP
jgi:hypothetical protein